MNVSKKKKNVNKSVSVKSIIVRCLNIHKQKMSNKDDRRKCGIINVSIKRNGKMVYSFNCWFCDTIYMQMKKFTMHLEENHKSHLDGSNDTGTEIEGEEKCLPSEDEEEPHVFTGTPLQVSV